MNKQDKIDLIEKYIETSYEEVIEFLSDIKAERWTEDEIDDPRSTFYSIKHIIENGRIGLRDCSRGDLAEMLLSYLDGLSEEEMHKYFLGKEPKAENMIILYRLCVMHDNNTFVSGVIT